MAKTAKTISVIERRLQGGGSVLRGSSQPIPLKEKGVTLMWGNSEISENQIWHLVNDLGWEYVTPDDIACTIEEIGAKAQDGRVVRGPRGSEVLLKMRTRDFKKVQALKAKENTEITFNTKKVKDAVLNEVGSQLGSEAADFVHGSGIEIHDSRERVAVDD